VLAIGLGVGAAQHMHLFAGSKSTAVPLDRTQQRYNASTSSSAITIAIDETTQPAAITAQLPAPGVYVYATTGRDSVDALTGAHHDYPATTTITVTPTTCGVQQRWDILEQRWEQWQRCADGEGISESGRTNYDEFFGQSQTDTWVCSGDARPLTATAGTTWTATCTGATSTDTFHGVVVASESQQVGSSAVPTTHVRVTITNDNPADNQVIDTWYFTGSDLVVAQTSTAATSNDTQIGTVHYAETYEIHLTSLTPLT